MRKGFKFIPWEDVVTPVYDAVSAAIPDQSLTLREMMMQFAYIGAEKLSEIVNRGFDGDEDEDMIGVDVSALDYAEVHDRIVDLQSKATFSRSVHVGLQELQPPAAELVTPSVPEKQAEP